MQPGSKSCLTMTNVTTAATLRHPGAIHQLEGIAREAVRIHTAEVVAFANHYGHPIPWEYRLKLFASFMASRPSIGLDHDLFMDLFRDAHGLWPNVRRKYPRTR
jgi:hypothetical protein